MAALVAHEDIVAFVLARNGSADLVYPNRVIRVRPHQSAPLPFVDVVIPPAIEPGIKNQDLSEMTWPRGVSIHAIAPLLKFAGIGTLPDRLDPIEGDRGEPQTETNLRPQGHGEREMQESLVRHLKKQGESPRVEVTCEGGRADIVTETSIYELKLHLSRQDIISAVGQVMVYRAAIDVRLKPVIVGNYVRGTTRLLDAIAKSGVEVILWPPDWIQQDDEGLEASA